MKYPPVHYHDYLKLDMIIGAQSPRSVELGKPAHDEMLFIITHQTYELWFKQMIHELDSVISVFSAERVDEKLMNLVISRMGRIVEILKLLNQQITVLETMTPLDFLEFRDMLFPASGFQSFQFRSFENKLGLKREQRLKYNSADYDKSLSPDQAKAAKTQEAEANLFECVEKWLERTPFLSMGDFDFWEAYQNAVYQMFNEDKKTLKQLSFPSEEDRLKVLKQIESSEQMFKVLFDETEYKKARENKHWRLSHKALHAALLIQIYRDQPILQMPFRLITALLDLDETLTSWRYRHALMAKRMLGTKIGTGGSSGAEYLRQSTEQHKVFSDFFQLTTFFIPRSALPPLPKEAEKKLGFQHQ